MNSASCVIVLPLGISRVRDQQRIDELRGVFGRFASIDFNVARVGEEAYSLRIERSRVPNAQGVMDMDETVGGMIGDTLRLTYGETVEFLDPVGSSVNIRFLKIQK